MCNYCVDEERIQNEGDFIKDCYITVDSYQTRLVIDIKDNKNNIYVQFAKINFCPMCGERIV